MRLTTNTDPLTVPPRWRSPFWGSVGVTAAMLLVFVLDRATDSAPVQHLYYLPIIVAARQLGLPGGLVSAVAAIVLYHVANPHLWDFRDVEADLVQSALFLVIGLVTAKVTHDAKQLHRLAMTDDLTGLHNLRSFERHLARLVRDSRASGTSLALLVLDLDRLKSLNDRYGHLTGAEAVRLIGRVIGECLPPGAIGCRYGGDEFVIALAGHPDVVVRRVAEDLCERVRATAPVLAGRSFASGTLSISVGVAWIACVDGGVESGADRSQADAGERLFRAADAALYRAKAQGRNRVSVVEDNMVEDDSEEMSVP